jgi:alpha-D-ribose 1-methylphosphonate 5-triphosphate diphosphatase
VDSPEFARAMTERAKRSHLTVPQMVQRAKDMWARRPEVPAAIAKVAALGRSAGVPMFSHDDSQPVTRDYYRGLGARVSEFPMNVRVARAARDAGDLIVFGAPNAARGGSHLGSSPNAAQMIRDGLCDVLASDYYYPAMLLAMARLRADGVAPLHELWRLVSANAARASGLDDRGTIGIGKRADLVLIDWPEGEVPAVQRTWVGGREAYSAIVAE